MFSTPSSIFWLNVFFTSKSLRLFHVGTYIWICLIPFSGFLVMDSLFWVWHNLTSSYWWILGLFWGFCNYQLFRAVGVHFLLHPLQFKTLSSILVFAVSCEENGIIQFICVFLMMNEIWVYFYTFWSFQHICALLNWLFLSFINFSFGLFFWILTNMYEDLLVFQFVIFFCLFLLYISF